MKVGDIVHYVSDCEEVLGHADMGLLKGVIRSVEPPDDDTGFHDVTVYALDKKGNETFSYCYRYLYEIFNTEAEATIYCCNIKKELELGNPNWNTWEYTLITGSGRMD